MCYTQWAIFKRSILKAFQPHSSSWFIYPGLSLSVFPTWWFFWPLRKHTQLDSNLDCILDRRHMQWTVHPFSLSPHCWCAPWDCPCRYRYHQKSTCSSTHLDRTWTSICWLICRRALPNQYLSVLRYLQAPQLEL